MIKTCQEIDCQNEIVTQADYCMAHLEAISRGESFRHKPLVIVEDTIRYAHTVPYICGKFIPAKNKETAIYEGIKRTFIIFGSRDKCLSLVLEVAQVVDPIIEIDTRGIIATILEEIRDNVTQRYGTDAVGDYLNADDGQLSHLDHLLNPIVEAFVESNFKPEFFEMGSPEVVNIKDHEDVLDRIIKESKNDE